MQASEIDAFGRESSSAYRGEAYLVRDNGAVLRQARPGKPQRPLDKTWTFGTSGRSDGYMAIAGHKVHRIVATAFHGKQPSNSHVVDHIDTNRRNNRPDNLRWVTRLENILLNPITAKRIAYFYGSIEAFLADPKNPRNGTLTADFEWMRAVSPVEAEYSRERMLVWARADSQAKGGGTLGDWVFGRSPVPASSATEALPELTTSNTPDAVQRNWRVPAAFPLCPKPSEAAPMASYAARLKLGAVAVISPWGETKVGKVATSDDGSEVYLLGDHGSGQVKPWSLARITLEGGKFVHESCGTFFSREGVEKEFTLIQGLAWDGEDSIDDYC